MNSTFAISWPSGLEWLIVGAFALIIFGRRLPEVARSIGKSIVEFKRGLRDVHEDINTAANVPDSKPLPPAPQKPEQLPPP